MSQKNFKDLMALVVDDDSIVQLILKKELDTYGIQSVAVSNGVEALETLKKIKFDFVMMDISMPEQDGLDTIRWIRDLDDHTRDLPIFAVTSFDTKAHTEELLEAGFTGHFPKPIDFPKFIETLKNYFWKA